MHAMTLNPTRAILLITLLLWVLAGCDSRGQTDAADSPPPPEVADAEVHAQPVTLWGDFTGRLEAPNTVGLPPPVSGYIEKGKFAEGALVKEGDVLFVIGPRPYQARLQLAQAELARMRSQL